MWKLRDTGIDDTLNTWYTDTLFTAIHPQRMPSLLLIVLQRISAALESDVSKEHSGSKKDKSVILTLRLIAEKYLEGNRRVYNCLVVCRKMFYLVWHKAHCKVFSRRGVLNKLILFQKNLYAELELAIKLCSILGDWFTAEIGSTQDNTVSLLSFMSLLQNRGIICGRMIKDLCCADGIDFLAESEGELQLLIDKLHSSSLKFGAQVNQKKSEVMVFLRNSTGRLSTSGNGHPLWMNLYTLAVCQRPTNRNYFTKNLL